MNRVRITLEVDSSFLNLLRAKCTLKGWTRWSPNYKGEELPPELDPAGVLAILVLGEGLGQVSEVIDATVPPTWRPHVDVIHDERRVYSEGKQIGGPKYEVPTS